MEAAAWGLIGTLVGALASIGTTWLSSRSSDHLQSGRLNEERKERAKAFQRETLLALQEAVHDALRLNARAHMQDFETFRQTGKWSGRPLTEEVNEGCRLANRRVSILVERVSDDQLRAMTKALVRLTTDGLFARSEREADLNQQAISVAATELFEHMGFVLRGHYEPRFE